MNILIVIAVLFVLFTSEGNLLLKFIIGIPPGLFALFMLWGFIYFDVLGRDK